MTTIQQTATPTEAFAERLGLLTLKQREVLDLLIHFKTSKEISRVLAISPHTVDQRIDSAKGKLGAASRSELALIYRDLIDDGSSLYDRLTYEDFPLGQPADSGHGSLVAAATEALAPIASFDRASSQVPAAVERDYRVVPELFDGRWGTATRLATILAITILLCVAFLGGLSIMVEVSSLMRR